MYSPFTHFIFRISLLPFNSIERMLKNGNVLLQSIEENYIQEAIYIVSPDLFKEMKKLKEGLIEKKEADRILFSIAKYISRMTTRCTPFGLFAGCSVGKIQGDETNILLEGSIKRHTRLDMYYLCTLSQELSKISGIKNQLRYFPNSTIYPVGNKLRYIEYEYLKYGRKHRISA